MVIDDTPSHVAAANGLSVVRSIVGNSSGRRARPVSGHEAVAELSR